MATSFHESQNPRHCERRYSESESESVVIRVPVQIPAQTVPVFVKTVPVTLPVSTGVSARWPQFLAASCASLGAFSLGTLLGWPSPVLPQLLDQGLGPAREQSGDILIMDMERTNGNLTSDQASWIASLAILGCVLATIPAGFFINGIGRRATILTLSVPLFLGWILIIIADSVRLVYAGRLITGFCCGAFSIAIPVYVGEIASKEYRGILGSFFTLQTVFGVLFAYAVGSLVDWIWLSIFCAAIPPILVITMYFMPNSPVYLISINKIEEAAISLRWLRGAEDFKDIESELKMLQLNQQNSNDCDLTFRDYLEGSIWKPMSLCVGIHMLQQMCGIAIAIVYCGSIFEAAGTSLSPSICAIIVGLAQVLGVAISTVLIDRAGRRSLLIFSSLIVTLCWIPLGVFFYLKEENDGDSPEGLELLPLFSVVGVVIFFSIGLGPIPWTLLGELLPNQVRGTGASIASLFNWLLSFFITKIYDDISLSVGEYTLFFMFSGFCLLSALFTHLLLPETKNKEYDEIQANFSSYKTKSNAAK